MTARVAPSLEKLYREAVVLADGSRQWFDGPGVAWRAELPADAQARVASESLAITAQLMAAMSWLLDPANAGGTAKRPFVPEPPPQFRGTSPLVGTPGEAIAAGTRRLLERVSVFSTSPPGTEADRVGVFDEGIWR